MKTTLLFTLLTFFSVNSFSQTIHEFTVDGLNTTESVTVSVGDNIKFNSANYGTYTYYVNGVLVGNVPINSLIFDTLIGVTTSTSFTINVTSNNTALFKTLNVTVTQSATVDENTLIYNVFPNPTTDFLYVEGTNVETIEIFDVTGKLMITSNSNSIDVSGLNQGLYYISINGKEFSTFKKQ